MAHAKHLKTALEEAAVQHEEAAAVIHRRRREGTLPTSEESQREADTRTILRAALNRYLRSGQ
jgi:hypothetical protein